MELFDFFSQANADYLEQLYRSFKQDPRSVDDRWAVFFAGFEAGDPEAGGLLSRMLSSRSGSPSEGVNHLVHSYRQMGHYEATVDPLGGERAKSPMLRLSEFGFRESEDLELSVGPGGFQGPAHEQLGQLVQNLRMTYCGNIGYEFMNIADKEQRDWLLARIEPTLGRPHSDAETQKWILGELIRAEGFEQYLHTKFVGQKRFSIQGAESVIPLLNTIIDQSGELGADQVVLGMAHRGRLNVLAHVIGKPYEMILSEFEGTALLPNEEGDGDVKYHMGFARQGETRHGKRMHLTLCHNPSHLELVNPVIEGLVKARQEAKKDATCESVVPVLIHGEAAFTGQGIVFETLNLSKLDTYRTGGTIHVIINNQVGFTATAEDTRFTPYASDAARMIQAPTFHVNGDDPEAVVHVSKIAAEYRQRFKSDVIIDVWCYRKYGHNETDDPTFTQPVMYQKIHGLTSTRDLYKKALLEQGVVTTETIDGIDEQLKRELSEAHTRAKETRERERTSSFQDLWAGFDRAREDWTAKTAISEKTIQKISEVATTVPSDFTIHPKIKKLLELRVAMASGEKPADWGCAEMWALGSLLMEGTPIRFTGQDCERGTFSHRHAVLHDYETGKQFAPLTQFETSFTIKNTMLSELAVLGFEYGYSIADPRNLVVWEAQFGDFVNGAQAILDQFLASGESKWDRMTGIVLLLPHGYEGQGPEHSSARLERFLQSCAENNMQVCYPSVPSQYFHLLRRQMLRKFRKPLVLMMPKSLLRDDRSSSAISAFTDQDFQMVLDDTSADAAAERVIFCTGKVFFTLSAARTELKRTDVALVRVEQLYPFPERELTRVVEKYKSAKEFLWVQEEPQNMGAWTFISRRLERVLPKGITLEYCGRAEAASPAHGQYRVHQHEEQDFVKQALRAEILEKAKPSATPPRPSTEGTGAAPRRPAKRA